MNFWHKNFTTNTRTQLDNQSIKKMKKKKKRKKIMMMMMMMKIEC